VREFLRSNPDVAAEIEQKIREKLLPQTVKAPASDDEETVAQEAS
jgi:hypothetical protein